MDSALDRAYAWLSLSEGLGPRRTKALLSFCPDPLTLMGMRPSDWSACVGDQVARNMQDARERVDDLLASLERKGLRAITRASWEFPACLQDIYDPPLVLYARGTASLAREPRLSMVGSRRCTRYGREVATSLSCDLARAGVTVVSGLARGVDTACHVGALSGGGETIAVLGCGVDVVYPPENAALFERIAAQGMLVSEYLPGTRPFPGHFPLRNRIIAGLSMGLVLVEAACGSGAMITVDYALEEGRTIFAVPGNITSSQSSEPNRLLGTGAVPTTCAADILGEMGWEAPSQGEREGREPLQLSLEETAIIQALGEEELSFEELLHKTGMDVPSLNSLLTMMVTRGIMKQSAGRIFWIDPKMPG